MKHKNWQLNRDFEIRCWIWVQAELTEGDQKYTKRGCVECLENNLTHNDAQQMWNRLWAMTDYKPKD